MHFTFGYACSSKLVVESSGALWSVHRKLYRSIKAYAIGVASIITRTARKLPNSMGTYIGTAMNLVPFLRSHHTRSAICLSLVDVDSFSLFSSLPRRPIWHSAGIQFRDLDESLVMTKRLLRYSVHEELSFAYEQSITDRVHRVLLYPFQVFVLALEIYRASRASLTSLREGLWACTLAGWQVYNGGWYRTHSMSQHVSVYV